MPLSPQKFCATLLLGLIALGAAAVAQSTDANKPRHHRNVARLGGRADPQPKTLRTQHPRSSRWPNAALRLWSQRRLSVIEPAYTKTQCDANFLQPDSKLDEYREICAAVSGTLIASASRALALEN